MEKKNKRNDDKNTIAVKAGLWYTISNFLIRSLSIISTPIFTRIMSVQEYGVYSNFSAWLTIISILATMDLHATLNRARFDYKKDIDGYISTITITSIIIPSIMYLIVTIFNEYFCKLLNMDMFYINMMFLSIIFSSSINIYQAKQRLNYEYKKSVFISLVTSVITVLISVFLVLMMSNKLYGRVIGQTIPATVINIGIAIYLILNGKKFKIEYMIYAIKICLPYVPHLLAMNILSQYDRIQINKFCGAESASLYSLAYSCALIINIFLNSMNNAWVPWLGDMLNEKKHEEIKAVSRKYVLAFAYIAIGLFMVSPEVLNIFGGKKYMEAIYVIPPIIAGAFFQFVYTLYVNIEMFEKKVWGVAFSTMIAAVLNIILNVIFIPKYGYVAAAYTTLVSYICLCALHYIQVMKINLAKVYDIKFIIMVSFLIIGIMMMSYIMYENIILRISAIILYSTIAIVILNKNKDEIKKIIINK